MILIAGLMLMLIMALQGAVIFGTAFLAVWRLKAAGPAAKIVAMALSWVAWVFVLVTGYWVAGGSLRLPDGFGFVLLLCATAAISSSAYLGAWFIVPLLFRKKPVDVSGVF